jgi:hypothetical protein
VLNRPLNYIDPSGHCAGTLTNRDKNDQACWDAYDKIQGQFGYDPDGLFAWGLSELQGLSSWMDAGVRFVSGTSINDQWTSGNIRDAVDALGRASAVLGARFRSAVGLSSGLVFVKYAASTNLPDQIGGLHPARGGNASNTMSFFLTKNSEEYGVEVMLHEMGHLIDLRMGGAGARWSEKNRWWHAIHGSSGAPSDYAKANPVEDFAESFAYYVETNLGRKYDNNGNSYPISRTRLDAIKSALTVRVP